MGTESGGEVFGKYRLLAKLAKGGMAEIFLAVQQGLHGFEKVVVIKRVLPELSESSEFVQMFLDEARLAARLDHTNIVRIYDFGEIEGQYYLAMEYLPGEDLSSLLQQAKKLKIPVPLEIAADLVIGAAEGLQFAHDLEDVSGKPLNLVHRDISPSNIIATYQGIVKLVDFGIARAETNMNKTQGGAIKGKFQYLAPEQVAGQKVDRRADLFSLGIVLHELLTTQRLFKRENELATINAITGDDILPPSRWRPDVPPELDAITMKALTRDRDKRYQTAAELAAELSIFLVGRNYVRGSKLVEFIAKMFGEERKRKKLRIAQGGGIDELMKSTPQGTGPGTGSGTFAPVRSGSGSIRKSGLIQPPAGGEAGRSNPSVKVVPPPAGRGIPRQVKIGGIAAGLVALGLVGFLAAAHKSEPEPVVQADPIKTSPTAEVPEPKGTTPVPDPKPTPGPSGLQVGGLKINGVPNGARVLVDGTPLAKPGAEQYYAAGSHKVEVEAKGFLPFEANVELAVGDVKSFDVTLKPRPVEPRGTVEISCQPWCQISVDGHETGRTSPAKLSLTAGAHALLLANPPAGLAKKVTVNVPENGVVRQIIKLDE